MAETLLVLFSQILTKIPTISRYLKLRLGMELEKLAEILRNLLAVLSDLQDSDPEDGKVFNWLGNLRPVAFVADDLVDEIAYQATRQRIAIRKSTPVNMFADDSVCAIFTSANPHSFVRKTRSVISSLEEAYKNFPKFRDTIPYPISKPRKLENICYTDSFVDKKTIVGREDDITEVVNMLIRSGCGEGLPIISIEGLDGVGKSTLAQLVYNHHTVQHHFDRRMWIRVSRNSTVDRLLNDMLQSLGSTGSEPTWEGEDLKRLKKFLEGERYLLVVDDVWDWEDCEMIRRLRKCLLDVGGSLGSKLMITTSLNGVAVDVREFGSYKLVPLPDELSWELFKKIAFRHGAHGGAKKTPELEDIGRGIVGKCGGLPLAIKLLGGLMSIKDQSEWVKTWESMVQNYSLNHWSGYSAVKLSYEYLPSSSLKRCFASCSMFDEDTIIEKERLIQIWMAQGLLNSLYENLLTMEDIGNGYFEIFLQASLMQDPQRDINDNITHCKMHDIVHFFSLHKSESDRPVLSGLESNRKDWNIVDYSADTLHLSFHNSAVWNMFKFPRQACHNLRIFSVVGGCVDLEDVFTQFTHLRVFRVEGQDVKNLPKSVVKLKYLRFLDISRTRIRMLPKSLTKLYNLQTLRTFDLVELPKGFHKLINLRHFYIERYCHNPSRNLLLPRIGQLTNLQTLPFFWVSQEKGCQIEELECLVNLGGKLTIYGLQNVKSNESSRKANLSGKSRIQSLELHWEGLSNNSVDDNMVLEDLQPHSYLKGLKIVGFQGSKFPSWMMLLRNLVELQLEHLDEVEEIPSLGEFASLKILKIDMLQNVKCLGSKFFRSTNSWESSRIEGERIILFPALREFELCRMPGLVEWSDAMIPGHLSAELFPNLEKLRLCSLPKLVHLPRMGNLHCLQQFEISYCESLTSLPNLSSLTFLQELEIIGCPNLIRLSEEDDGLHGLLSLENLCIGNCPNLEAVPGIHDLPSLHKLQIESCDLLTASLSRVQTFRSLKFLDIYSTPAIWPGDIHYLTSLRTLHLGGFSEDVDYFPWPGSVSGSSSASGHVGYTEYQFASLKSLQLYGWPLITSLPEQMQYLPKLIDLRIIRFNGLAALPEWLGKLQCLQNLELFACKNLKYLPSRTAMLGLTDLQTLRINRCPLLKERCTRGSGEEWPKIDNIRKIYL